MPNDALITQLNQLREAYAQQQKASNTLQSSLKAFNDGVNKIRKALSDDSLQETTLKLEALQSAFGTLRLKEEHVDPLVPDLRRDLKRLAKLTSALKDAVTALNTEPVDVIKLDKAVTTLEATINAQIGALLPELKEELTLAQRALGDEFGAKLRDALTEYGVTIGGRAPKFELGRFELDANFAKRVAVLRYGKDVVVPRLPITVEAAVKAYQASVKLVSGRNQDGAGWMKQFFEAYQTAQRKTNQTSSRVNIVDCYLELTLLRQSRAFLGEPIKKTFTDYTRAQFLYDFYEYTHQQRLTVNGFTVKAHSAAKSQVDIPTKSMWMVEGHSPYDGRYIADIEFTKD